MKAISFPLLPGTAGAQIANLQAALERLDLGANIPAAERRASQFGPETQSAVKRFQKAHSIASDPPGSVDAATAGALNQALYERRALYRLVGQVTGGDGLDGLRVIALRQDPGGLVPLGDSAVSAGGKYALYFDPTPPGAGAGDARYTHIPRPLNLSAQAFSRSGDLLAEAGPAPVREPETHLSLAISGEPLWVLEGEVTSGGLPLVEVVVEVYDRDLGNARQPLFNPDGPPVTGTTGTFRLAYAGKQFRFGEGRREGKITPDLVFVLRRRQQRLEQVRIARLDPAGSDESETWLTDEDLLLGLEANRVERLRFVIDDPSVRPVNTEFARLSAALKPVLAGHQPVDLEGPDQVEIRFAAREIGEEPQRVAEWAVAWRLSHQAEIDDHELFYGLLRDGPPAEVPGLPADLSGLLAGGEAAWRRKLDDSVAQEFIAPRADGGFDEALRRMKALRIGQVALPVGPGRASVEEVLVSTPVLADADTRQKFLALAAESSGQPEEFWRSTLPQKLGWAAGDIKEVQNTLQLAELTDYYLPLLQSMKQEGSPSLFDLAHWNREAWQSWVEHLHLPEGVPAAEGDAWRQRYIDGLIGTLEIIHPTPVVARLAAQMTDPHLAEARPLLERFFADETRRETLPEGFDIRTTPVNHYLEENRERVFHGLEQPEMDLLAGQLRRLQRTFQISGSPEEMQGLLSSGLDSAHAVMATSEEKFVEQYSLSLGSADAAQKIYQRASEVHANVTHIMLDLWQYGNDPAPAAVLAAETGTEVQPITQSPAYIELFGALDLCDCEHCRSVYSPAAYFVDTLHFLESSPNTFGLTPLDVLIGGHEHFGRRPDLAYIQLNCENTNTRIPTVDLINEIMESFVAHRQPEPFNQPPPPPKDLLATPSEAELGANPIYLTDFSAQAAVKAYAALQDATYSFDLPFNRDLLITRIYLEHLGVTREALLRLMHPEKDLPVLMAISAETLGLSPQDFELITSSQFDGRSSTLMKTIDAAYGFSTDPDTGADFPYFRDAPRLRQDDPRRQAVMALQHYLNLEGAVPALTVNGQFDAKTVTALKQFQAKAGLLTSGEASPDVWDLFPHGSNFRLAAQLSYVPIFLDTTRLVYQELVDLVSTRRFNPGRADMPFVENLQLGLGELMDWFKAGFPALPANIHNRIVFAGTTETKLKDWVKEHRNLLVLHTPLGAECQPDQTTIRHLDNSLLTEPELTQIAIFLRLRKKLGWSIHDTDRLYEVLGTDIFNLLLSLADAIQMQRRLELEPRRLLSLWGHIETTGDQPLYDQLFRSRAAMKNNPAFDLDDARRELKAYIANPANPPRLSEHIPALLSALRLRQPDLDQLLAFLNLRDGALNLDNLSSLYRYSLLAKTMRLPITDMLALITLSGQDPFPLAGNNLPQETLKFLRLAEKVQTNTIRPAQLKALYQPDPGTAPGGVFPPAALLSFANDLQANLARIHTENALQPDPQGEFTRTRLAIFLENAAVMEQGVATLMGTWVYQAPLADLAASASFPAAVAQKASYDRAAKSLSFRGAMTPAEKTALLGLAASLPPAQKAPYTTAVNALFDAPRQFLQDNFADFLPDLVTAGKELLDKPSLDVDLSPILLDKTGNKVVLDADGNPPAGVTIASTAAQAKFQFLLERLLPWLRARLERSQVVQSLTDTFHLEPALASALLDQPDLLPSLADPTRPALDDLLTTQGDGLNAFFFAGEDLHLPLAASKLSPQVDFSWGAAMPDPAISAAPYSARWTGALLPGFSEEFTFTLTHDDGVRLWVDGKLVVDNWVDGPQRTSSGKLALKAGKLVALRLEYYERDADSRLLLTWSSPSTPAAAIPTASLFSLSALERLLRVVFLLTGFGLSAQETSFLAQDKTRLDLSLLPARAQPHFPLDAFNQWLGLADYAALRQRLSPPADELLDILSAPAPELAEQRLAALARWQMTDLDALTGPGGFDFSLADFHVPKRLLDLADMMDTLKRLAISARVAQNWARISWMDASQVPPVPVWAFTTPGKDHAAATAQAVKNTARSKHEEEDWLVIARPLSDVVRDGSRAALASYALAMPEVAERNIHDANGLFAYFLIDVETSSCAETSRILAGISSVQLFIQRCLMNLEDQGTASPFTVTPAQIDAPRWEWMKQYRLWEANRKVLLYPENWIEPALRDDKSPLFRQLETDLQQNELTAEGVESAFRNYLGGLDRLGKLQICGLCEGNGGLSLYVFGRTRANPPEYYFRHLDRLSVDYDWTSGSWTPWEKVQVDIAHVEDGDNGEWSGVHVMPVFWNRRLYVFWPTFTQKPNKDMSAQAPKGFDPILNWEIRLAWSEYWEGKWSPKVVSSLALISPNDATVTEILDDLSHAHVENNNGTLWPRDWSGGVFKGGSPGPSTNISDYLELPGTKLNFPLSDDKDHLVYERARLTQSVTTYLPHPGEHQLAVTIDNDGRLLMNVHRRYSGSATGKTVKRIVQNLQYKTLHHGQDSHRESEDEGEDPASRPVKAYQYLGRFVLTGCQDEMRVEPHLDTINYESLVRPGGSTNFFDWYTPLPPTRVFATAADPETIVLASLASPAPTYLVIGPDDEIAFDKQQPFFYQDVQRSFLVTRERGYLDGLVGLLDHDLLSAFGRAARLSTDDAKRLPPIPPQQHLIESHPWLERAAGMAGAGRLAALNGHSNGTHILPSRVMSASPAQSILRPAERSGVLDELYRTFHGRYEYIFSPHWHPFSCAFIDRLLGGGLPELLTVKTQALTNDRPSNHFQAVYTPSPLVGRPYPKEDVDEERGAFSSYNWEIFFHAPLLIASSLSSNGKYKEARQWFHYIFNPTDNGNDAPPPNPWAPPPASGPEPRPQRYWKFWPFKITEAQRINDMMTALSYTGTDPEKLKSKADMQAQIRDWQQNPFSPHRIARMRLGAYMKNVVMRYIDNLIAWGDALFRQDTIETINEAEQLYVLAADLLGPRPQTIRRGDQMAPQTFASLRAAKLDDISNARVTLETRFPFASSTLGSAGLPGSPVYMPTALFFCTPNNDKLLGYWDTVADRLFKIRHCMNIEGVVRQLPLFQPPIDPALLVQAAARGVDLGSVLRSQSTARPHYRFSVMLQKALEFCGELRGLGNALQAVLEKKDAEDLALLRAGQEVQMLSEQVRRVKVAQVEQATHSRQSLEQGRAIIEDQIQYYQGLIEAGQNDKERKHLDELGEALDWQAAASISEALSSLQFGIPDAHLGSAGFASPFFVFKFGGVNLGHSAAAAGRILGYVGQVHNFWANEAQVNAGWDRRMEDWKHQLQHAQLELKQVEAQLLGAQVQEQIASWEVENHDRQTENARDVESFLQSQKYTNQELYGWMRDQVSALYFQAYQMAYEAALQAEAAYRYERGVRTSDFIQFGTWDSLRKGLLAGDRLYQQLHALERAFQEENRREFEITRHVSLASLAPDALLALRETGSCTIDIPEWLFDLDYPGHYMRRIKTLSLSIPAVVGPYTGVNARLTLLKNTTRISPSLQGDYAEAADGDDERFMQEFAPIQSIAASGGVNESGLFEMNFHDERYLPFEGAGVISRWRIELPGPYRQFDYDSITDAILTLKYTARDGGEPLKAAANKALKDALSMAESAPLMRLFSVRREFPDEWYKFLHPADANGPHTISLKLDLEHFPYMVRSAKPRVSQVELFMDVEGGDGIQAGDVLPLLLSAPLGVSTLLTMSSAASVLKGLPMVSISLDTEPGPWTIQATKADFAALPAKLKNGQPADLLILVRYSLKG